MFHSDTHIELTQPYRPPPEGGKTFTRSQIQASIAVSMGSMIVGYSSAWSSPAIASLMEPGREIKVTSNEASWIGSLMPLAALIGGFIGGSLLEALGRKKTILSTAIPFIVAGLIVSFAQDVYMIYAGRAITGFCIGIISLSLPVYLAETISPEVRGTLGLLPTSIGNAGVMLCYIFGFWLDWSYLSLIGAIIPLPFLFMVCTIPETPRFLVANNKATAARASLQWLRGSHADITAEFKRNRGYEYTGPQIKFSGINAVLFYSVSIFESAGSSIDSNLATIILGIVNICATIFSNVLIDRLGRKILLYISLIGMIGSLGVFWSLFLHEEL
ncbi:TRET1 [Lepeophtheirus salmonis]|uniref:TRET1 n=1 Tax=Lepeophtheirus salmonis TaxID=72036 RepID=A0A7R8H7P9_LEPSM|nr:TRET1 [Lepeophtheirus salmonis]CAF2923000.1 TRET1 [Lepeophtheirus salmonis]